MIEWLASVPLENLVAKSQLKSLKDELAGASPSDICDLIEEVGPEKGLVVLRLLRLPIAADVFSRLGHRLRQEVLNAFTDNRLAGLLNSMAPDDRTRFFEEMPGEAVMRLLNLLNQHERQTTLSLLGYPEDSVGRLMTPHYILVRPDYTVEQAIQQVKAKFVEAETASVLYVVDDSGVLLDDVQLGAVVAADSDTCVRDLMDHTFLALQADQDQEEAVALFRKHYRLALPVVDRSRKLLGIVTLDDVLEVAEKEATEDFQRAGGLEALDDPYFATPFWTLIKKRAGWLLLLFISEMATATAMGKFEDEITKAVVLALFVPLIISSGGNSGSQAATLIIRALAVGEVKLKDWWRIMRRELITGIVLGTALGVVGFLRITVWNAFGHMYGVHWSLIAATILLSLIGVVTWGTLSGSMLPIILKRIGLDPAVSSAPAVATLVDVTGIFIYFEVANLILRGTLL